MDEKQASGNIKTAIDLAITDVVIEPNNSKLQNV